MRKILCYLVVFGGFISLNSCEKVVYEYPLPPEQVSFQTEVKPIILNNCVRCHEAFKTSSNYYIKLATANYIDTVNVKSSKIYTKLTTDDAHKGYLSTSDYNIVIKWFDLGAKNN